jgi:hypothetical protein
MDPRRTEDEFDGKKRIAEQRRRDASCQALDVTASGATMRFMSMPTLALVSAMIAAASSPMLAQAPRPGPEDGQTTSQAQPTVPPEAPATQTGKERLGNKWMDEQRTDNCNVPIDKRGTKSRPDTCPDRPTR